MHSQRYWLANAHHQAFSVGEAGVIDPPAQTQRQFDVGTDFSRASLYDQMRGRALTASGAVAWSATAQGAGLDFAAAASGITVDYPTYAPPARLTMFARVKIGTVREENIITWVQSGSPSTYDRQLYLRTDGKAGFYVFTGSSTVISGTTVLVSGQIVTLAATYDGTTYRLYVDGRQEGSAVAGAGFAGYTTPLIRLGRQNAPGATNNATSTILNTGIAPVAYDAGQIAELWQNPTMQTMPRRKVRVSVGTDYTLSAEGISREYSFGAATLTRGFALSADGLERAYSLGPAGLVYQPAQVGDTHDGFLRRSRRERALEAAARRQQEEWQRDRNAVRLALEAAMGMAAEVVEDAPPAAVEAVEAAQKAAAQAAPVLARRTVDVAALAEVQALVSRLTAAVEEAARMKALADDDEEVLMLLRAL